MKLQVYVMRLLATALLFAICGLGFLVFPAIAINAVHSLEGAGVRHLLSFMPLVAIELVPYLLPLAFLLAVVGTFGRLAADNEWTAIRMAGVNPARLLLPGLLIATALSALTGWVAHELSPSWKFQRSFIKRLVSSSDMRELSPGRTEIHIGDFFLKARSRPEGSNTFYDVLLYVSAGDVGRRSPDDVFRDDLKVAADVATLDILEDGLEVSFVNPRVVHGESTIRAENPRFFLPFDELLDFEEKRRDAAKYYPSSDLEDALREGSPPWTSVPFDAAMRRDCVYEIHRRNALSVTCVLFLLLGFPTGIWLKRGSQLAAFAAAVGYAFLYYVLSLRVGEELAASGAVRPEAGAWSVNAAGSILGLLMTWKVLRR